MSVIWVGGCVGRWLWVRAYVSVAIYHHHYFHVSAACVRGCLAKNCLTGHKDTKPTEGVVMGVVAA